MGDGGGGRWAVAWVGCERHARGARAWWATAAMVGAGCERERRARDARPWWATAAMGVVGGGVGGGRAARARREAVVGDG